MYTVNLYNFVDNDIGNGVYILSTVLSIRIPRRLKEEMDKLKDKVNWKKEIIRFIEERINYYKRQLII